MKLLCAALTGILMFASRAALACPSCIGNQDKLPNVLKIVGIFMLLPFALAALILYAIVRAQRAARALDGEAPEPDPAAGGTVASDGSGSAPA